jgi:hypothetical protein
VPSVATENSAKKGWIIERFAKGNFGFHGVSNCVRSKCLAIGVASSASRPGAGFSFKVAGAGPLIHG